MTPAEVQALIENNLPHAQALINSEDNSHFEAVIICPDFDGKTPVKQHQMVYRIVNDLIQNNSIHALNLKTYTPQQYAEQTKKP